VTRIGSDGRGGPVDAVDSQSTVVHETKLLAPALRPGWVERTALEYEVERGAAVRLTLVSAGVGAGKSTLLAQWASTSHDGDVAWLTLDRGDNSPTIFWTYVVSALRTVRPGFGEQVLRRLQAPGIVIEDDVLPLIVDATSGLAGVALVLDDYHAINDEDVHEGLRYLIERLPAGVRVVIGTQVDPPLGLDRLRAQGDLHELRDLSLSADQTAALLRAVLGVEPEEAAVRGLHEWTALPRRDLDPRPLLRPALRGRHPARRRRAAARGAGARQRLPRHPRREHALVPVPPGLPRRARPRARRPSGPPTATGRTAFSATSRSTAGRSTRRSSLRGRHSTRRGNTTSRSSAVSCARADVEQPVSVDQAASLTDHSPPSA
jgi:hypothetical protein